MVTTDEFSDIVRERFNGVAVTKSHIGFSEVGEPDERVTGTLGILGHLGYWVSIEDMLDLVNKVDGTPL